MVITDRLFWVKFANTQYAVNAEGIKEALEIASKWRDEPVLEIKATGIVILTRDIVK